MSPIHRIEEEILRLHGRLSLTPTLHAAARLGELLEDAKKEIPHGQFERWVKARLRISPRLAQTYMQIAKAQTVAGFDDRHTTIDQFLRRIRTAKYRTPDPAPDELAGMLADVKAYRADCRKHDWEGGASLIIADPPWVGEDWAYDWTGHFAQQNLRDGGVCLVQCGTAEIPRRLTQIAASGLNYWWCMALVYPDAFRVRPVRGIASTWRPILAFVKGKFHPGKVVLFFP